MRLLFSTSLQRKSSVITPDVSHSTDTRSVCVHLVPCWTVIGQTGCDVTRELRFNVTSEELYSLVKKKVKTAKLK